MSTAGFPELLARLGYNGVDNVSIRWQRTPDDKFDGGWAPTLEAAQLAVGHPEENVWFGVNKARQRPWGRATNADVTRLTCLYADLDIKPKGLANLQMALDVITDMSGLIGTRPVAVILSGHGLQPLWAVDPEDPAADVTDVNRGYMVALMRRFGRLMRHVADTRGGRVDSVFDLARVLRVPGTVNWKDREHPVACGVTFGDGRPLTIEEIDENLTKYDAVEQPGDREEVSLVLSHAAGWQWAGETRPSVRRAIRSWARAEPTGRHPWLIGVTTSLNTAYRLGWITEYDYQVAADVITARFLELTATGPQKRTPQRGELADAFAFGRAKAQSQVDQTVRADWEFWEREEAIQTFGTTTTEGESWQGTQGSAHSAAGPTDTSSPPLSATASTPSPPNAAAAAATPITGAPGAGSSSNPWATAGEDLWTSRAVLAYLQEFARSRQVSPLAMLGVVMARVVAAMAPSVVLPKLVGSYASINLFVGVVAASGRGKGVAEAAAADAIDFGDIKVETPGSGEGIAHGYMKRVKGSDVPEMHTTSCLFSVAEVDTLAALRDRSGSTLMPELRKAWMGERLGFSYADPAKRLPVPAGKYRMSMVVGIQPGRASTILDDSDGGTPQRFLWFSALDPDAPETPPEEPEQWFWHKPLLYANEHSKVVIKVCQQARDAVRTDRLAGLRGVGEVLDAHAMLARLKAATALALLEERLEVTDDDWRISGMIMELSNRCRDGVVEHLRQSAGEENRKKGVAEGTRAIVVAETIEAAAEKRVARSVMRRLTAVDSMTGNELRKAVASRDRQYLDTTLERLIETGLIRIEDAVGGGTQGVRYRTAVTS